MRILFLYQEEQELLLVNYYLFIMYLKKRKMKMALFNLIAGRNKKTEMIEI